MTYRLQLCCRAVLVIFALPLAAVVSSAQPKAAGTEAKKVDAEPIFYDPFPLDELYDKIIPEGSSDDVLSQGDGPTRATIKAELRQCKVFLVARKIQRAGKWGLTYDGGYPKLLVEGMAFTVKDKKGRNYDIQLCEVFCLGADLGLEWQTCDCAIGFRLQIRREFLNESELGLAKLLAEAQGKKLPAQALQQGASVMSTQNFISNTSLEHDVHGKTRWLRQR